jgi:hypothetical protein
MSKIRKLMALQIVVSVLFIHPMVGMAADFELFWDPSCNTDTDLEGYYIHYNAEVSVVDAPTDTTKIYIPLSHSGFDPSEPRYQISGLLDDVRYCFAVTALYGDKESDLSNEVCGTKGPTVDPEPEPGPNPVDSCGEGLIIDCAGNCVDANTAWDYVGDGYCDDGTWGVDLRCPAFDNDSEDCTGNSNPGDNCGEGLIIDCADTCVDENTAWDYVGDGYCDDGTWGVDLRCPAFDNDSADCTGHYGPGEGCGNGLVIDCAGNCVDLNTAWNYVNDDYCDDGTWGFDLRCLEFDNDGVDCDEI